MKIVFIATAAALLLVGIPANCSEPKPLTFQVGMMGEIEDTNATKAGFHTRWWSTAHFGFTGFKASNGNYLTVYYDDFTKPEEAKRFLDWKVENSAKVLSRSTGTDANGKPIEYRAEVQPQSGRPTVEVIWVVDISVHWIRANSVDDALELEKQYRR